MNEQLGVPSRSCPARSAVPPRRHALSREQRRSDHARDLALGLRFPVRPARGARTARALARRADWPGRGFGALFFGLFFVLYNIALGYTTAARASLALSTLPLQTMIVGALLGIEPLSARKCAGVAIAMGGVLAALGSGLAGRRPGRGGAS